MPLELDHLFVCTATGAPAADRLIELGFAEGPPNTHPGQGTANRRFFFANAMLEFVWVENEAEARSDLTSRTLLADRCERRAEISPFGVIVRPGAEQQIEPPFPAWEYRPLYLPPPLCLHIAETGLDEPMWIYMNFAHRAHRGDGPAITALALTSPHPPKSVAARAILSSGILSYHEGPQHSVEIEFDHARQGRAADLSPHLPLQLRW
jgi:hypothetical protein